MLLILSNLSEEKTYRALNGPLSKAPCGAQVVTTLEQAQILAPNYKALLVLGPANLEKMQSLGLIAKNRTVGSSRTQVIKWFLPTMVSYSPAMKELDYRLYVDLLCDAQQALTLAHTGSITPALGAYQWVPDLGPVVKRAQELLDSHPTRNIDSFFDTETVGLDYVDPTKHIVSLQFCLEVGKAFGIHFPSFAASTDWMLNPRNQEALGWLLNHPRIKTSAANGKYDLLWVWFKSGVECTNFTFDTTLVGSLLDENRSNGLDVHAKIYTPLGGYSDEFDRTINKSRMDLVAPERLLPYACGDVDAGLRVKNAQRDELVQDPALTGFYLNLLHPAARAFEIVERGGVFVDKEAYLELEADLTTAIHDQIRRAKAIMGGRIVAKHMDLDKVGGINLTKAALLKDFMFTDMGLNLKPKMFTEKAQSQTVEYASTGMEHLQMFSDLPEAAEFIQVMEEFSSATKTLSTYVHGFKEHLRHDGKFHPTHFLFVGNKDDGEGGTNTGRLSVRDPAFQTIPKHTLWGKRIRRVFVAPDGMLVLENDYSQGELKVIACLAHEEAMIHAYMNNMDLHVATSGFVAGLTYDEMMALKKSDPEKFDSLRQLGKAGNFGLIYGMGVDGFIEYARSQYGVTLSQGEATAFRSGFFERYPGLPKYHASYKAFAKRNGYVCSPLGRKRHLPLMQSTFSDVRSKEERRSINAPVQSTLSDMMIWCIALGVQKGWHETCPPFGVVHDAKYTYIPEDNYEFYAKREVELMENLPFEQLNWNPQLKFTADAKAGKNMADLKAVKF